MKKITQMTIDRDIKNPKYIQQHRQSTGEQTCKFMYYSNEKHEMTDMYTTAIFTIKYKHNDNSKNG